MVYSKYLYFIITYLEAGSPFSHRSKEFGNFFGELHKLLGVAGMPYNRVCLSKILFKMETRLRLMFCTTIIFSSNDQENYPYAP